MQLSVDQTTLYRYDEPLGRLVQLLKMTPASFPGQTVVDWRLDVNCDAKLREGRDGYGNITHMLYLEEPVQQFAVSVTGCVLTENQSGIVTGVPGELPPEVFLRPTPLTAIGPNLEKLSAKLGLEKNSALGWLHRLNSTIHERMEFDSEATTTRTDAEHAFGSGRGVCQDFAHIFIAISRRLGVPARYISGHLFRRDGEEVQEAAHAWAEAWLADLGWVAFDPTHGICTDDSYVRIACGLDYREASPVSGSRSGGGAEKLDVEVQVRNMRRSRQEQAQSQLQN